MTRAYNRLPSGSATSDCLPPNPSIAASLAPLPPPQGIVIASTSERAQELADTLRPLLGGAFVGASIADEVQAAPAITADVALIELGGGAGQSLQWAGTIASQNPFTEIIFFAQNPLAPDTAAALSIGINRVLHESTMLHWLRHSLPLLGRAASLRRASHDALASCLPLPPLVTTTTGKAPPVPLRVAESQFREVYLRRLLADTGSRREAARRAGVPYRTLCEIITKLGISTGGTW